MELIVAAFVAGIVVLLVNTVLRILPWIMSVPGYDIVVTADHSGGEVSMTPIRSAVLETVEACLTSPLLESVRESEKEESREFWKALRSARKGLRVSVLQAALLSTHEEEVQKALREMAFLGGKEDLAAIRKAGAKGRGRGRVNELLAEHAEERTLDRAA